MLNTFSNDVIHGVKASSVGPCPSCYKQERIAVSDECGERQYDNMRRVVALLFEAGLTGNDEV